MSSGIIIPKKGEWILSFTQHSLLKLWPSKILTFWERGLDWRAGVNWVCEERAGNLLIKVEGRQSIIPNIPIFSRALWALSKMCTE